MSETSGSAVPRGTRPQGDQDQERRKNTYEHAIQEMEKHISVAGDGQIILSAKSGPDIQVDPDIFNNLSNSLRHVNGLLVTRQLLPSQVHLKTPIGEPSALLGALKTISDDASMVTAGACASFSWCQFFWWGIKIHMNECATQDLILDLQIQAAVWVIAALFALPAGGAASIAMGIVAALFQLGAAVVQWRDNTCGNVGIVVTVPWTVIGLWIWCS